MMNWKQALNRYAILLIGYIIKVRENPRKWGSRGRRFKSSRPDQIKYIILICYANADFIINRHFCVLYTIYIQIWILPYKACNPIDDNILLLLYYFRLQFAVSFSSHCPPLPIRIILCAFTDSCTSVVPTRTWHDFQVRFQTIHLRCCLPYQII